MTTRLLGSIPISDRKGIQSAQSTKGRPLTVRAQADHYVTQGNAIEVELHNTPEGLTKFYVVHEWLSATGRKVRTVIAEGLLDEQQPGRSLNQTL